MEIYGTAVADKLDNGKGLLRRRYYRQHCTLDFGSYTKDLSAICSDLASVFILDNSPGAYRSYPGTIQTLALTKINPKIHVPVLSFRFKYERILQFVTKYRSYFIFEFS